MKYERDTLLKDLRENVLDVRFTKVNGEERIMRCTLDPEHLPTGSDVDHLEKEHKKPENKDVLVVWDVQKHGWRSFRIESVQYAQALDTY